MYDSKQTQITATIPAVETSETPHPKTIQQPTQIFIMSINEKSKFTQYQMRFDGTIERCEKR